MTVWIYIATSKEVGDSDFVMAFRKCECTRL
jgi:hypothetical protein